MVHFRIRVGLTYRVDWLLQISYCLGDQSLITLAVNQTVSSAISLDLIKLLNHSLELADFGILLDYSKLLFFYSLLIFFCFLCLLFCFLFLFPLTHLSFILPETMHLTIKFSHVSHGNHRADKEKPNR